MKNLWNEKWRGRARVSSYEQTWLETKNTKIESLASRPFSTFCLVQYPENSFVNFSRGNAAYRAKFIQFFTHFQVFFSALNFQTACFLKVRWTRVTRGSYDFYENSSKLRHFRSRSRLIFLYTYFFIYIFFFSFFAPVISALHETKSESFYFFLFPTWHDEERKSSAHVFRLKKKVQTKM